MSWQTPVNYTHSETLYKFCKITGIHGDSFIMSFAVQLFFDSTSETIIQNARERVSERWDFFSTHDSADRPSLSLALYDELDITACVGKLKVFAEMFSPVCSHFLMPGHLPGEEGRFLSCANREPKATRYPCVYPPVA